MKFRLTLVIGLLSAQLACSGHNLRPGFKNEREVMRRQWTYSIEPLSSELSVPGMEYVSPVLVDNTLLFGSDRFGLVALYPKIMLEKWKIKFQNGIVSPLEIANSGSTPAVFYTAGDGNVYANSLSNGKTLWTYGLRNPVTSQATVVGNDLYLVTSDDTLIALEAATGKWQWHYRRRNVSGPTIHGAAKPLVVGDQVWVGFADGSVVALSRKEGKVIWEKQLNPNKRFPNVNAELVLQDDVVYVPAYDNALYALNSKTGTTIWARENRGGSKKVSIADGVIYAPTSQSEVYALDAKTGKDLWRFELDEGIASNVVVLSDHVTFTSSSTYLYVLDKKTGTLVWRMNVGAGSGFSGGVAYDAIRNWIYVLSRGGNLMGLSYHPNARKVEL